MDTTLNPAIVTDLQYTLEVMEEYSHLGLDNESAKKLREILLRRISEAEAALDRQSARPVHIPSWKSKVLA
jgi:hypothetical protein